MNKELSPEKSKLLINKLAVAAQRLQQQASPNGANQELATLEKSLLEGFKILRDFYRSLSEPSFKPKVARRDTQPSIDDYNKNFLAIKDDLDVLFNEFENLETLVLGNFNYMVSRLNRLNRRMKLVSSKSADYNLYTNLGAKDAVFFSDTFTNLSRIESNTPLLTTDQAEINEVEGIVTLPIDRKKQQKITIKEVPVINSNSNGSPGNSHELGAGFHGNLTDVLDGNADTWFEYERVLEEEDNKPLVLDLTINLGEVKVVNFIRINPNNFGTRTQVEIVNIDTSVDGNEFISVKDDIPIAGWTIDDEANIFTLAPSTSKFAGQGLYTFTPRKAKFVRLTLRQSTSYIITTSSGPKIRYAVGIRDVEIAALPYKKKGEVISVEYQTLNEIKKVALLSNQNPKVGFSSNLASIKHFVSPDNGISWHELRPLPDSGIPGAVEKIPEILDFNGVAENTIVTTSPINSVRYRAVLERNTDAFTSNASELMQVTGSNTELHQPPTSTPLSMALQKRPIKGSIKVVDPNFGSRGKDGTQYPVAIGNAAQKLIRLPWKPIKKDIEKTTSGVLYFVSKVDPEKVFVDGVQWTRTGNLAAAAATDKVYALNYNEGSLEFGDGTNGKAVPSSAVVSMTFDEERIFPSHDSKHLATLDYPTSNDQKQFEVYAVSRAEPVTILLQKGSNVHQLKPDMLSGASYPITFSDATVFATEQTFKDGDAELTILGHYSIDYTNGVLYSEYRTSTTNDTTVRFFYTPRTKLADKDWSFASSKSVIDSISIGDSAWKTIEIPAAESVPTSVNYFGLANLAIVRGTVTFTGGTGYFDTEVEFVDGKSELLNLIKAIQQIPSLSASSYPATVSFNFSVKPTSSTQYSTTFSDTTVFVTERASLGAISSAGDFFVDRSDVTATPKVYVRISAGVADPGKMTFYYPDPTVSLTGRYSINYKTGEVYTYTRTTSGITVSYEYTDYRVRYNVAREVSSDDWELDETNNKIILKDREILLNNRTPQAVSNQVAANSRFYQISYNYVVSTRQDVNELEPYFTPVLKDYALKVVDSSRLV